MDATQSRREQIRIDSYKGAYGTTVRIAAQTMAELTLLAQMFKQLSAGTTDRIELLEIPTVAAISVKRLTLVLWRHSQYYRGGTLEMIHTTPEGPAFRWAKTSEGWLETVGLVEGLGSHGTPAHQYLTDEIDDAIIEITYRE